MSTSFRHHQQQQPFMASIKQLLSNVPLTPTVRTHIAQVYSTLASMMLLTASVVYFDIGQLIFPWFDGWVSILSLAAIVLAFQFVPRTKDYLLTRHLLLFSFAFAKGLFLAPFVNSLGFISNKIVPQATISTFILFSSFSLAAMYAKRRTMIYTLGMLGTLSTVSFAMFVCKPVMFNMHFSMTVELLIGLCMASLYIVCDTQLMVYRASMCNFMDPITQDHLHLDHAIELYMDLVQMFVHVAMILARRQDDGESEDDRSYVKNRRR